MYAIHTTPGFIISSRPSGEAGKLISIFTQDLGLIRASAQGIRFEKSKLRPFIQDYSLGVFSFVRGKEYWRLTNAQEIGEKNIGILNEGINEELIARIALLLGRLLQGEESHPELFITLNSLFDFLKTSQEMDAESWKMLESLIVIRILYRLGYVANLSDLTVHLASDILTAGLLTQLKTSRLLINQHINKALRESHL